MSWQDRATGLPASIRRPFRPDANSLFRSICQANGLAVAGFFLTKGIGGHDNRPAYSNDMPGEGEQEEDPIFQAYKKMAKDQSWLADLGMSL